MRRYLSLMALCLAVFLVMLGMGMAVTVLPGRFLQVSGSPRSAGWLASIFALSYMLSQFPAGRWADRHGYRLALAAGCLLIAASAALYMIAASPVMLYLGRFIQGAGEAPVWAAAPAMLGRLYPDAKGRVMGLYSASFHLGLVAGPGIGIQLTAAGRLDPFMAFSILCLVAGAIVFLFTRDPKPAETPARPTEASFVKKRGLWAIGCGILLFGTVYGLIISCLPVHLISAAGFSKEDLRAFFFFAYLGIGAAQLTGGELSDRLGRPGLMIAGLVSLGCGLFGFTAISSWSFLAGVTAMGLGLGVFSIASLAYLNEIAPDKHKGTVAGLYYSAWGFGYFAGPLLVDYVWVERGMRAMATYALMLAIVLAWRLMFASTARLSEE